MAIHLWIEKRRRGRASTKSSNQQAKLDVPFHPAFRHSQLTIHDLPIAIFASCEVASFGSHTKALMATELLLSVVFLFPQPAQIIFLGHLKEGSHGVR
jgi:hypothetical protein